MCHFFKAFSSLLYFPNVYFFLGKGVPKFCAWRVCAMVVNRDRLKVSTGSIPVNMSSHCLFSSSKVGIIATGGKMPGKLWCPFQLGYNTLRILIESINSWIIYINLDKCFTSAMLSNLCMMVKRYIDSAGKQTFVLLDPLVIVLILTHKEIVR